MSYIIINPDHPIGDKPRDRTIYPLKKEAWEKVAILMSSQRCGINWTVLDADSVRGRAALRNCSP